VTPTPEELLEGARCLIVPDEAIAIDTQDDYDIVAEMRKVVNKTATDLDARRKKEKEPSLREGKRIDEIWMPAIRELGAFLAKIDANIKRYRARAAERQAQIAADLQAQREQLQWEALDLMKDKDDPIAQRTADELLKQADALQQAPETIEGVAGVGLRSNWKMRVIDPVLFYKSAPNEYKLPNESALNAEARRTEGKCVIPGCETYNDAIVASSRK